MATLATPRGLGHSSAGQPLPGHPATSILHPGVTLRARSFLLFPQLLPDPISSPHPHSEGARFSSTRESLVRSKVNGGPQNGRWRVSRACQKRGAPRPFAHPLERLETRPSATRSDDSLTRSVPEAQLYSLCVDFKTGRVILKHCRDVILDKMDRRSKKGKEVILKCTTASEHPLKIVSLLSH